jgi:hypothetical protein
MTAASGSSMTASIGACVEAIDAAGSYKVALQRAEIVQMLLKSGCCTKHRNYAA